MPPCLPDSKMFRSIGIDLSESTFAGWWEGVADEQRLSYEERSALCARMSYPLMQTFEKWMLAEMARVMPKGRNAKA